jgi:hypothetical protein
VVTAIVAALLWRWRDGVRRVGVWKWCVGFVLVAGVVLAVVPAWATVAGILAVGFVFSMLLVPIVLRVRLS